jgi:hypothetical protein
MSKSRRLDTAFSMRRMVIILGLFVSVAVSAQGETPVFIEDSVLSDQVGPSGIKSVARLKEDTHERETPCVAKIGDIVSLEVGNLAGWLEKLATDKIINSKATGEALVLEQLPNLNLFIGEHLMKTLKPTEYRKDDPTWYAEGSEQRNTAPGRSWLEFTLKRDAANKASREDWDPVLRTPGYSPQLQLAVGIYDPNKNIAHIMALPVEADKAAPQLQFHFQLIAWDVTTVSGVILLLVAVVIFFYMSIFSGMVRDTTCPVREDGLPPFSLGRCQMAFWFFLVISAFYFIWVITGRGDTDTINSTILTLIGISAGTALGSAIVGKNEAATKEAEATTKEAQAVAAGTVVPTPPTVEVYPVEIKAAQEALAQATAAGDTDRIRALTSEVALLKGKLKRWRAQHRGQLLKDLLSEQDVSKGENRVVTFHRFQIVVWTLVLGVVFVSEVLTKLAMPVFDNTLLTLMGISSGTYLGFKVSK